MSPRKEFSHAALDIMDKAGLHAPELAGLLEDTAREVKSLSEICNKYVIRTAKDLGGDFIDLDSKLKKAREKKVITEEEFKKVQGENYEIVEETIREGEENLRKCKFR